MITATKTKESLQQEISNIDAQIDELQAIITSSIALRNTLEFEPISLETPNKHNALKAASERTRKLSKLQETIDIAVGAEEALDTEKSKLERELSQIFKLEKEAEREQIRQQVDDLAQEINHQVLKLQKDIEPLKNLIKTYNKTYGNNEIPTIKKWMTIDDIDDLIYKLDFYFLWWDANESLKFSYHYRSGFGNSEGRQNIAKIKQQLEEKINEQRQPKV